MQLKEVKLPHDTNWHYIIDLKLEVVGNIHENPELLEESK